MSRRHVLVIGAGIFGTALAKTLYEEGHEVVLVDREEARVEAVMHEVTHAAIVDATDEEALKRLGLEAFDTAVVAISDDFEAAVLATIGVKTGGVERVIAKAASDQAARVLRRVGADDVVRSEYDTGVRLAQQIATPNVLDAFPVGEAHEVVEIRVTEALLGDLSEVDLRERYGVAAMAVIRGEELTLHPDASFRLRSGDRLVVIGDVESVDALRDEITP